jgi:hypothetical protein
MSEHISYRKISKTQWGMMRGAGEGNLDFERRVADGERNDGINTGCLQRIADACELMAKNHNDLVEERDRFQLIAREKTDHIRRQMRTISTLRGVITKLKKKAEVGK